MVLREPAVRDLDAIVAACADPEIQRYTRVPSPYLEADARAFVGSASTRRILGQSMELVVAARADDRLLGMIGLISDRYDHERAEIGYWIAPAARGRGVATRALRLLSRWAVTDGGFARIDLQAAISNIASLMVAERCGFVMEGVLRRSWYREERRSDMAVFSLLPEDIGDGPAKRASRDGRR